MPKFWLRKANENTIFMILTELLASLRDELQDMIRSSRWMDKQYERYSKPSKVGYSNSIMYELHPDKK